MTPKLVDLPLSFAPHRYAPDSSSYDIEASRSLQRRTYTCVPRSCAPSISTIAIIGLSLISLGYGMCTDNDCINSWNPEVRLPITSGLIMLFIACVRATRL